MKKILISILVVLLSILTYFLVAKNVTIGKWSSSSFNDIKEANDTLNEKINLAKELSDQDYNESIEKLESAEKNMKKAKEKYESKKNYVSEDVELGVVQIKEYKIERLWIALENYAKDENVTLKLDIVDNTSQQGIYDLNVTVAGSYIGITDFIYDIEKDDTLGFKILNFKLVPTATSNASTEEEDGKQKTTTVVNTNELTATFNIEDVGIELN